MSGGTKTDFRAACDSIKTKSWLLLLETMDNTFILNPEIASMILSRFHEYLGIANDTKDDLFYKKCREQLETLDAGKLKTIFESVFTASLVREEGRHHHFSVVITPALSKFADEIKECGHGSLADVTAFEKPVPIANLPKIAPAFEGTNQSLRIWFNEQNEVEIWGFANGFMDYYGLKVQPLSLGELLIDIKSQDYPWLRFLMTFSGTRIVQRSTPIYALLTVDSKASIGSNAWHNASIIQRRLFGFSRRYYQQNEFAWSWWHPAFNPGRTFRRDYAEIY